ncbi:MAG: hypothetical protein Q7S28_01390 [bacterium]|nr:hypothetical protein [bacterium]
MPDFSNTQDLVDLSEIRDKTVIMKDGSLRQVLMVSGINFSLKSEEEQNLITAAYQNFLNTVEFSLQIIIHSRKINIQKYLDDLGNRLEAEVSPILQNQIAEYREFIGKFVTENAIMEKTFFVVVPWFPHSLMPKTSLSGMPFGKKSSAETEKKEEEIKADLENSLGQLRQRVSQVTDGLGTIGLEAILLNDEQLIELFYNFYNPETVEKENIMVPDQLG